MEAFTYSMIHKRTLEAWSEGIDTNELTSKLRSAIVRVTTETIDIQTQNPRLYGALMEIIGNIIPGLPVLIRMRNDPSATAPASKWDGVEESELTRWTLLDLSGQGNNKAIQLLMMCATYRGLILQQMGPIPGLGFNLTIAGMIATCMMIGIAV